MCGVVNSSMMKKPLLFVIDDDPVTNLLVSKKFADEGYKVVTFEKGEQCIDALSEKPSLIILDYIFTNDTVYADGLAIFDAIKERMPGIPVVMFSAQKDGEKVLELVRKGIADYIIKSDNAIENLVVSVKDILGKTVE